MISTFDYLIIGHGHLGQSLYQQLNGFKVCVTYKTKTKFESSTCSNKRIFVLEDETTWENLPSSYHTFILAPFKSLEHTKKFWQQKSNQLGKVIIIGSTGQYLQNEGQIVRETDLPIHPDSDRAQCEHYIKNQGAILALSSGIYGGERHPLNWLKKGLIKENKWINLIHRDDLSMSLKFLMKRGKLKEIYNISNGQFIEWQNILDQDLELAQKVKLKVNEGYIPGKKISIEKLLPLLPHDFSFKSL